MINEQINRKYFSLAEKYDIRTNSPFPIDFPFYIFKIFIFEFLFSILCSVIIAVVINHMCQKNAPDSFLFSAHLRRKGLLNLLFFSISRLSCNDLAEVTTTMMGALMTQHCLTMWPVILNEATDSIMNEERERSPFI